MPKLTAAEKSNRAPSLQGKMAAFEGSSSPDHMRPSLNTAFSPQVYFCKVNFELIKPLHFHHTPPSCTAHLCPSSHCLHPPQPPGDHGTSPGGCPSCIPNQQSPHLAQTNPLQLTITLIAKKQIGWQEEDAPHHLSFFPSIT